MDFAARNHLPAVYAYEELVEAGGLMSFGPNYADMHRRAATYVDRILKGAKPSDLPARKCCPSGCSARSMKSRRNT